MITPRFSLSQDDNFLIITIIAPYCDLKELETYVENHDFRFVCTPYYLRLNLPGKIIDDDNSCGQFLSDSGEFIFNYSKVNKGQHFEGLNFITSLLSPAKNKDFEPNIQVLSDLNNEGQEWHIEQKLPEEEKAQTDFCKYGFANQKYSILKNTGIEFRSVFDLHNPDETSLLDRKYFRHDTESMNFNKDHFLADYFEDDMIKNIIKYSNPWTPLNKDTVTFSEKEKYTLMNLPNKEYLLNKEDLNFILYSLIDILYAYCYDKRTTDFESSCESGWTITKLSGTLSWFDAYTDELEAVISGFRRSLIYPLYRNYDLCQKVLEDLKVLLNLGPVFIIKCLINIYDIFNTSSDPRYIINDLYIKDYIIFMQKCPKSDLEELIQNVKEIKISKKQMNLNLEKIIETAVKGPIRGEDILKKMTRLNLKCTMISDSSSDSDSESESSESSTDSDDESSSSDSDTTTIN